MNQKKPNIVFIMTDQQRLDTISSLGCGYMHTPHLDRLTENGTSYTNAFCSGATCVSSRASLFTGLYPHNTGVYSFDNWSHQASWVQDLRDGGYYCANVGKMHIKPDFENIGFHEQRPVENKMENFALEGGGEDDWGWWLRLHGMERELNLHKTEPGWEESLNCRVWPYEENLHPDIFTGDLADAWIGSYNREEPFFLQIGFPGPHEPYDPPERFLKLYENQDNFPPQIAGENELNGKPPQQTAHQEFFRTVDNPSRIDTAELSGEDVRKMRRYYSANISLIDEKIGQILDRLEETGQLENTVVIFTSDHGDNLGDHHLPYKWLMYDSIVKIPLIIADFRNPPAEKTVSGDLASLIDIGPTVLDYAGLPSPSYLEGRSLTPGNSAEPEYVFCEDNYLTMIRSHDFKMVYYLGQESGELYDLKKDPGELNNLWDREDHRPVREELKSSLLGWLAESVYMNKNYRSRNTSGQPIRHPRDPRFGNRLHGGPAN